MTRVVTPEILDHLPVDNAEAAASRRDLARLNGVMRHAAMISRELDSRTTRIVDLGGGDGTFLLQVIERTKQKPREVVLVDRQRAIAESTIARFGQNGVSVTIETRDVVEWLAETTLIPGSAMMANLFLHHFPREEMSRLLTHAARVCDLFIACEPRRARLAACASALVGVLGCNRVTRHDAVISVRAGFRGEELSEVWPRDRWKVEERSAGLFSHLFVARRQ